VTITTPVTVQLPLAASRSAITAAAASADRRLRIAAAYHPLTPNVMRAALAADPDPAVSGAAANAAQYGTRDLEIGYAWATQLSA
jgi:hypothetical protein